MYSSRQTLDLPNSLSLTLNQPFALYQGQVVKRGQFWAAVHTLAARLPDRPYVFNLCENRYLFCLYLLAAAARGQVSLLPPSNQMAVVHEILQDYPGAYLVSERDPQLPDLAWLEAIALNTPQMAPQTDIDWKSNRLIAFTSGSTGRPKPCIHNLETFRISADMAVNSLGLAQQTLLVLSTTPPQHMFGLETSVFWPLFSNLILHDARPFFPEDVQHTIATVAWPVLLTTTPTHLRALTNSIGPWLNLSGIISATDVLSEKLADETAAILGQSPREIYGSTETLSFARRETLLESHWIPYQGCRVSRNTMDAAYLDSPHLPVQVMLQDKICVAEDGRFTVLGRHHDMIKIGGKRASLCELNRRLTDIDGVEDGFCFIQPGAAGADRLAVVVVSCLDKYHIRLGLQAYVDEVFLPRKIFYVPAIPRNPAGKLVKAEITKLLAGLV